MEKKLEGVHDGFKELGAGKMAVLGIQHVFAMFGATVLVPLLTGLSVAVTLFCAGIGTILFYFITKRKVPIFLGSSFAFLAAFATITRNADGVLMPELLPYATGGVVCAGAVYVVLALLFQVFGAKKIMKLFPPVVTGPIIILIGLILAPVGLINASSNWILAIVAIALIIIANIYGKGMVKILPLLIGIFGSYIVGTVISLCSGNALFGLPWVDFTGLKIESIKDIVSVPPFFLPKFEIGAIITCCVVALAAMIEHIGDIAAIGATCGKNFIADPGLTRTLLGDGLATSLAGVIGGPANTTYSENTGVVALTKVYDPKVMLLAAIFTVLLSFISIFESFINTIPWSIIGGVSLMLYGMISATGVRTIVENKVDFKNFRNVIVAALILACGLGFNTYPLTIVIGSVNLSFGGLACAAVIGIFVNAVLPGKDYQFDDGQGDISIKGYIQQ
ncbi:MAG: solute carrier family 23 protein [Clostridia bacterium]